MVLLGFDCKSASKAETHFFGKHPPNMEARHPYPGWIRNFTELAKDLRGEGIEVINSTRDTALACWPRMSIEKALGAPAECHPITGEQENTPGVKMAHINPGGPSIRERQRTENDSLLESQAHHPA